MSSFGEGFKEQLNLRFNITGTRLKSSEWIPQNTNLKGKPFSFKDHEYQIAIVDDRSQIVTVKKCAQIGLTEVLLREVLRFLIQNQGSQAIFTQPTDTDAGRFAKSRVDTLFEDCAVIKRLGTGGIDSTSLKRIGTSFLNIRGTFGSKSAISVPSDMNIYDEVNFSNPNVLSQYKSRLQHSEYKFERAISTPTLPNYGVSALFTASDQKRIIVKCTACNHYQFLNWDKCIYFDGGRPKDPEMIDIYVNEPWKWTPYIGCEKCTKELDRSWIGGRREWIAAHPDRTGISGYGLGQLDVTFIQAEAIVKASDRRFPEGYKKVADFYNFVLGEDYQDKEAGAVDDETRILSTVNMPSPASATGTFIGIDLGTFCHCVVIKDLWFPSEKEPVPVVIAAFKIPRTELEDFIPMIYKQYRALQLVSDAMPYTTTVEKVAKTLPNMHICYYGGKKRFTISGVQVTANNTQCLDEVTQGLGNSEVRVASEIAHVDEYWDHCKNLMKVRAEDDDGVEYYQYIKVGDDHFGHATGYALLAREIYRAERAASASGDAPIEISGVRTNL